MSEVLQELGVYDFISDNGVECPGGLSLHELDRVTRQLLISNCMYDNKVSRYEAIEYLEEFLFDSEGNAMGY